MKKYGTARETTNDKIRRMPFACWTAKAKDTHTEYVIFITYPRQQLLSEGASVLNFTYFVCLSVCLSCCRMNSSLHLRMTEVVNARTFFNYRHH
jgi:hypothetical protein